MTHDRTRIYNVRPPPPGRETITIGDRRRIKLEYIGNMNVIFHGKSDQRITLIYVAYVTGLGFNLYSLHAVQRTHLIVSDASGTHIIGANLTFPRSSSRSYLHATRLPAGTVGARRRQGDMRATNLLRQLGHPIPPPPQEIPPRKNMCATGLHNSNVPGVVTVLEPTPFPPLSSLLGEIQVVGNIPSRPACRIGTPGSGCPDPIATKIWQGGRHQPLARLPCPRPHASVLKATAKQHGIRLTEELVSCSTCSRAKGHRVPTPHHATRRATQPLGLVHIDTAGPYPTFLGGSRYVVMFVDSASHLQRPYGVREKSAAAILSVMKRFVADMGVPRAFRTDNGTEYSNSMFVDFCNGLGIRREFTAPYTPQQNGPVESAISRAFKAGHAARLGVLQLYPDIRLEEIRGCTDAAGTSLWLEALLWASECYNRAATSVNDEWLSPHEIFYGSRPRLPLLPFLQPAYHRVPRQRKTDPRARMRYFLNFGYNHRRDCYRLLDAETGRVAYSRDVTWHHPETPWIIPIRAVPTELPRDIYVPMPQSVPVAAPSPAPVATPPAPASAATQPPPPTPTSNSPAPIPPHVSRKLEHEGYVEMPGRTCGETRALRDASRDYAHRYGIPLDHAAMMSMLAKDEATNEIVHRHGASKDSPDLPTAHASDLPTPNNVSDVEKSPHADIWRHSMHQEFNVFLQAGTFAPAPA